MAKKKKQLNAKYTKSNLPSKVCEVCDRPFEWRKKWADCWDEVKYCSDRCRRRKKQAKDTKTQPASE